MKEKDLEKLFRERLYDQEVPPSDHLWTAIEDQLDTETNKVVQMPEKHSTPWSRYAAAACILVLLSVGITFYRQRNNDATTPIAQHSAPTIDSTTPQHKQAHSLNEEGPQILSQKTQRLEPTTQQNTTGATHLASNSVAPKTAANKRRETLPLKRVEVKTALDASAPTHKSEWREIDEEQTQQIAMLPEVPQTAIEPELPPIATRSVTEIDPVKPLIEPFEEEEEFMIARQVNKVSNTIINGVLDVLKPSGKAPTEMKKETIITRDEEGSLHLDLGGLFARNRNRKHR